MSFNLWPMKQKEPVSLAQQMRLEADAERQAQHRAAVDHLQAIDAQHELDSRRLKQTLAHDILAMEQADRTYQTAKHRCALSTNAADSERFDWRTRRDRAEAAARAKADPRLGVMIDHVERSSGYATSALLDRFQALQLQPDADLDAVLAQAENEHGAPMTRTVTREQFRWGAPGSRQG